MKQGKGTNLCRQQGQYIRDARELSFPRILLVGCEQVAVLDSAATITFGGYRR